MRVPVSTYRVQANRDFPFGAVKGLVGYLSSLGVGDLYCSPILTARSGSAHCYDVVDYATLNPELGGEDGLRQLVSALRERGMGILLDIVPNHMSASAENPYWMDVLEYGRESPYARTFDIEWETPARSLRGKVLLPVLDRPLADAVTSRRVALAIGRGSRPFVIRVGEDELPVSPPGYLLISRLIRSASGRGRTRSSALLSLAKAIGSWDGGSRSSFEKAKGRAGEMLRSDRRLRTTVDKVLSRSPDATAHVLAAQNYLLAHWRDAETKINYRRFLNVNELVAVRVEDMDVFMRTHSLVLDLLRSGRVQGVRVDHADGLRDPTLYFRRLRSEAGRVRGREPYVLAEKILQPGRRLPAEWDVSGTTGYGFMNDLTRLYVKQDNEPRFDAIYQKFTGNREGFRESVYQGKLLAIGTMRSELRRLADLLRAVDPSAGDGDEVADAIREVAARFRGYRIYVSPRSRAVRGDWRRRIEGAAARAGRGANDGRPLKAVEDALLLNGADTLSPGKKRALMEFVLRFQQFTAAVAVKGEEDTALYRYNRLTSLNEVGGDPTAFGESVASFHRRNLDRNRDWPFSMLSTSTHDTKRSEDVRARLDVLSEIPGEWEEAVWRWRRITSRGRRKGAPAGNDEYLFYQTLLGAWPHSKGEYLEFVERVVAYMRKASKEERTRTSWTRPSAEYDRGLETYVRRTLEPRKGNRFLADFMALERKVDWFGMLNSLSQTIVKLTAPGVPDVYQGNELWDYSLVDPDNRRTVDFKKRKKMLERLDATATKEGLLSAARSALSDVRSGGPKLHLTATVLRFRSANRALFRDGGYLPLKVAGGRRANLCSYSRQIGGDGCVVFAPRFFTALCKEGEVPLGRGAWGDTRVAVPWSDAGYGDVLTGRELKVKEHSGRAALEAAEVLSEFPVGLVRVTPSRA